MSNDNSPAQPGPALPYQPPQPQYGAPQPQAPQYGAPQPQQAPQYGAPHQPHHPQQAPQYGAPQQPQYGAPQQPQQAPPYGAPPAPPQRQPQSRQVPAIPSYPPAGAPGSAPQGGYPNPPGSGGPQPQGSNTKIIGIVVALLAVFAIVGGVIMFVSGRSTKPPAQPTISQPTDQPTDQPTGQPTDPTSPPTDPQSGSTVPIAEGVTATLPNDSWKVKDQVTGGVVLVNAAAKVYLQIQAEPGQKTDSISFCGVLQDAAAKGLANVQKNPCSAGNDVGRVKTAHGSVTGTYSGSNVSYVLGAVVLAGVRDDGLVTGTQLLFAAKSPPSSAVLKEVSTIYASVITSENAAP